MPFKPVLCPLATKRCKEDDGRDGLKIPLRKNHLQRILAAAVDKRAPWSWSYGALFVLVMLSVSELLEAARGASFIVEKILSDYYLHKGLFRTFLKKENIRF